MVIIKQKIRHHLPIPITDELSVVLLDRGAVLLILLIGVSGAARL